MFFSGWHPGSRWKPYVITGFFCIVGFIAGWFVNVATQKPATFSPIRLFGYTFTNPLLSCNFIASKLLPEDQGMSTAIQSVIQKHEQLGDIEKASTYFVNLGTSAWSDTFEAEKYYPSSLGKIPIMLAYYEMADASTTLLDKEIEDRGLAVPPTAALSSFKLNWAKAC